MWRAQGSGTRLALACFTVGSAIAVACSGSESGSGGACGPGSGGASGASGTAGEAGSPGAAGAAPASWLSDARIAVEGEGVSNLDCRAAVCAHNEDSDLIGYGGGYWLVQRSAPSDASTANSALYVYQSPDARAWNLSAVLAAPSGRDLRDPHFYALGSQLFIEAVTRLPVSSLRDAGSDSLSVAFASSDGIAWSSQTPIAPSAFSFWRPKQAGGVLYAAAYTDGDLGVALFSSVDGLAWARGADIYTVSADTPREAELLFLASGELLALVRLDGTDQELRGDSGRLRTKICSAMPPYDTFACASEITGARLDGAVAVSWLERWFVIARKHLLPLPSKRTALFELSRDAAAGGFTLEERGELPSSGDTSYAGLAMLDPNRALVSWYSSNVALDPSWSDGQLGATDIWTAVVDFSQLP